VWLKRLYKVVQGKDDTVVHLIIRYRNVISVQIHNVRQDQIVQIQGCEVMPLTSNPFKMFFVLTQVLALAVSSQGWIPAVLRALTLVVPAITPHGACPKW
jgi:hypothetical protein